MERYRRVNIIQHASVRMRFEPDEIRGRSLPEFSHRHVMPAALKLAEEVTQLVRMHGGGEHMVTVDQNMEIEGIPRAAMDSALKWQPINVSLGLSGRGGSA